MTVHLTTRVVAERLGKSRATVLRLAESGELPGTKLPGETGTWIFTTTDVEAYVARQIAKLSGGAA